MPPNTTRLTLHLSPALLADLTDLARRLGLTAEQFGIAYLTQGMLAAQLEELRAERAKEGAA